MVAQRFVLRIGEDSARPAVHVDEAFALRYRQALEERGVDEAEDRGVGADAQRQRQHGGDGESRLLAQHAGRVAQVVKDAAEAAAPRRSVRQRRRNARLPQRAHPSRQRIRAVELLEREPPCVFRRGALRAQLPVAIVEMLRELLDDLGLARRAEPQRRQPGPQILTPVTP